MVFEGNVVVDEGNVVVKEGNAVVEEVRGERGGEGCLRRMWWRRRK